MLSKEGATTERSGKGLEKRGNLERKAKTQIETKQKE